jgi:hypothetical protein
MRRSQPQRRAWPIIALCLACALSVPGGAAAENEPVCPLAANTPPAPGPALAEPVTLAPSEPTEILNFNGDQGTKSFDVVLRASEPLPASLTASNLAIDVPERFKRVSDTLETKALKRPTFTRPRFLEGRKVVFFRTCVDAGDADAGTYSGQIVITGPEGLEGTASTVTINTKNRLAFLVGLLAALLAAFGLLLYRAGKVHREKHADESWKGALIAVCKSFEFWAGTLTSIIAAAVAIVVIYAGDPAWGADLWPSLFALAGTAFGAAGVGSLIATVRKGS